MRIVFAIVAILVAGLMPDSARAESYPWCAILQGELGSSPQCYYVSEAQCRNSLTGGGGFCNQNPAFSAPESAPSRKLRRR